MQPIGTIKRQRLTLHKEAFSMAKEKYERTELEIISFQTEDVICTSSPDDYEGWNPYDNGSSGGEYEGWNPH